MSVPVYFYVSQPRGSATFATFTRKGKPQEPPTDTPPAAPAKIPPRRPAKQSLQRLIDLAA